MGIYPQYQPPNVDHAAKLRVNFNSSHPALLLTADEKCERPAALGQTRYFGYDIKPQTVGMPDSGSDSAQQANAQFEYKIPPNQPFQLIYFAEFSPGARCGTAIQFTPEPGRNYEIQILSNKIGDGNDDIHNLSCSFLLGELQTINGKSELAGVLGYKNNESCIEKFHLAKDFYRR